MALRLVFMGTPDFAVHALQALIDVGHRPCAVYTRPPAKSGRGMKLSVSPVQRLAEKYDLPVVTPTTLKDPAALDYFAGLQLELCVVVAYGMILPQSWLDAPVHGCWNIHASLLPRWRGAAPIQRAIMAGDTQTGVAVMQMQAGLDTGPVLMTRRVLICDDDTASSLHDKLAHAGGQVFVAALAARTRLQPVAQAEAGITYAEKIDKAEGRIDWQRPAHELDCHIRALSLFPGAWFSLNGVRIKILRARVSDETGPAGTIGDTGARNGTMIYCGRGAIELLHVQRSGKAAMSIDDFRRGGLLVSGTVLD